MGKYIKNLFERDKDMFHMLNKCGNADHDQMKQIGLSERRIKDMQREKLIEKTYYSQSKQDEKNIKAYQLTDKGKSLIEREYGLANHNQSVSVRHNIDVANKYLNLEKEERETVLNERELRDMFLEKLEEIRDHDQERYDQLYEQLEQGQISMPDIAYTSVEGVQMAFETVTDNYGNAEIQAKEEACTVLELNLKINRI
ncbi:MAG: hypothetical protein RR904_05365 [Bacilli bacterium]